ALNLTGQHSPCTRHGEGSGARARHSGVVKPWSSVATSRGLPRSTGAEPCSHVRSNISQSTRLATVWQHSGNRWMFPQVRIDVDHALKPGLSASPTPVETVRTADLTP